MHKIRRVNQLCVVFSVLLSFIYVSECMEVQIHSRSNRFMDYCLLQQNKIICALEEEEAGKAIFIRDAWEKIDSKTGSITGKGITAVLQRGDLLEKAAVSTTYASGILTAERAASISSRKEVFMLDGERIETNALIGTPYKAAALSLVLHSRSPMVPTFRSDIRYFELNLKTRDGKDASIGWFGGGADLTPYYLFDEDAEYFHSSYRNCCQKYDDNLYPKLKKWCDDYFYIPVRNEHRGVGGIFFDDLERINELSGSVEAGIDEAMKFTFDVCDNFMPSYLPIVRKRRGLPYTEEQRHWQLLRRGRYIEFNMLYDRGVKFGLVPNGRIEAVFVSCPPLVAWDYNYIPKKGSEEERLMEILRKPISW